jgi:hypothetical protein
MATWTWAGATPAERAAWVRDHFYHHCFSNEKLTCDLFNLTEDGCNRILAGEDWRPEFERE